MHPRQARNRKTCRRCRTWLRAIANYVVLSISTVGLDRTCMLVYLLLSYFTYFTSSPCETNLALDLATDWRNNCGKRKLTYGSNKIWTQAVTLKMQDRHNSSDNLIILFVVHLFIVSTRGWTEMFVFNIIPLVKLFQCLWTLFTHFYILTHFEHVLTIQWQDWKPWYLWSQQPWHEIFIPSHSLFGCCLNWLCFI